MIAETILIICGMLSTSPTEYGGTIGGKVVDDSRGKTALSGAEVVLRVKVNGEEMVCGETTTDENGRFTFHKLSIGKEYVYIPGANRDGVHYPGQRLQLTAEKPLAIIELSVCDSVSEPSPLVIRRQEIYMRSAPGVLTVSESICVDNPTTRCYVGMQLNEDGEPVTMQLSIPSNFDRTTFEKEFFGRRFLLLGGKVVTGIPWPPGSCELKFTYTLPIEQGLCRWQRPLDLPCEHLRIAVQTDNPKEVHCNLPGAGLEGKNEVVFESSGETLPTGQVIEVEIGHFPLPLMSYARWMAVLVLLVLFLGGAILGARRSQSVAAESNCEESVRKHRLRKAKAA